MEIMKDSKDEEECSPLRTRLQETCPMASYFRHQLQPACQKICRKIDFQLDFAACSGYIECVRIQHKTGG